MSSIEVYKFGGASVKDADNVKNVANILRDYQGGKLVVVISAMGKMTNALEQVINAYYHGNGEPMSILEDIKSKHLEVVQGLEIKDETAIADILDTFVEIEWILEDEVQDGYDYLYDQIVSVGELLSTKIVYYYLKSIGLKAAWLDVRDVFLTDNTYREARILWEETQQRILSTTEGLLAHADIIITQGFIGSTSENFTTTLGREGSDYSAGIFSYALDAESLTIWKDVPGILTADPSRFDNVSLISRLDYREAIEMMYFGAKVIHAKTIKPLQNKGIKLFVKPFSDPAAEGTIITSDVHTQYPPVVVIEPHQTLIHISTKDFSFVAEKHLSEIFELLDKYLIKVNMMRNTAISFSLCVTSDETKIAAFIESLNASYNVMKDEDLQLITIRHYDDATVKRLTEGKTIIFEERLENTIRFVVKNIPQLSYK